MKKTKKTAEPVRIAARDLPTVPIAELVPYENNAKLHGAEQIRKLRASLREFGFVSPVLIDEQRNVIAGHGRIEAAKAEGMTEVPYVTVGELTEAQRRAYIIADNRLTELGEWDAGALCFEMGELQAMHFDTTLTGFEMGEVDLIEVGAYTRAKAGESTPDMDALSTADGETDEEYSTFVDKFKPKLTTDDCYTPPKVYEAVREWAVGHYGLQGAPIVRPFYPGGDYRAAEYPEGCVVLDNPPFSALSEICRYYMERGIRFFLFAPALSLFSTAAGAANYLVTSVPITYENGACVRTGFVHNLGSYKIESAPELYAAVAAADREATASDEELPVYAYPTELMTPIRIAPAARYVHFAIPAESCAFTRALDAQRAAGRCIYGGGFLISEKAAAERISAEKAAAEKAAAARIAAEKAAAEKAAAKKRAAHTWELSERERALVRELK